MPLFRRAEFVRRRIPKNLTSGVTLYFLELTAEAFTDYEEFCYRTIQCNSAVWTCKRTGRTELTYAEALESERDTPNCVLYFPDTLNVPVLYLALHASKRSFTELVADIFNYVQCHYFINESVVFKSMGKRQSGIITNVEKPGISSPKSNRRSLRKQDWTPPGMYLYTINTHMTGESTQTLHLYGNNLQRPDSSKWCENVLLAFLKSVTLCNAQGIWVIKDSLISKYKIKDLKFEDLFVGEPPSFCFTGNKNVQGHRVTGSGKEKCVNTSKWSKSEGSNISRRGSEKSSELKNTINDHSGCTQGVRKVSVTNECASHNKQVQQNFERCFVPSKKLNDISCRTDESSNLVPLQSDEPLNLVSLQSDEHSNAEVTVKEDPVFSSDDCDSVQKLLICSEEDESDSSNNEIKVVWSSTVQPIRQLKTKPPTKSLSLTPESQRLLESMPACVVKLGTKLLQGDTGCLKVSNNDEISYVEISKEREVFKESTQSGKISSFVSVQTTYEDKDEYADKMGALQNDMDSKCEEMIQTKLPEQIQCASTAKKNKFEVCDPSAFSKKFGKKYVGTRKKKLKVVGSLKPWVPGKGNKDSCTSKKQTASNNISPEKKAKKKNWLQIQREIEVQEKLRKREERPSQAKKKNWLQIKREMEAQEKLRKIEESLSQKAKLEEEKLRFKKFMKEWRKTREDLVCEDSKPLPIPCSINFEVPNELFGEFVMLLEFFNSFKSILRVKSFFPSGFTFELLERALVEKEIAGPLHDIMKLMLSSIFSFHDSDNEGRRSVSHGVDQHLGDESSGEIKPEQAVPDYVGSSDWNHVFQDVPLSDIPLEPVTITEVLRIHLLSSDPLDLNFKCVTQQTGDIYLNDPGQWSHEGTSHILSSLCKHHVCELSVGEKLDILRCLMNQILASTAVREILDLRLEDMRKAKTSLRASQLLKIKLKREATVIRIQEKKGAKESSSVADDGSLALSQEDLSLQKQKSEKDINKVKEEIEKKSSKIMPLEMSLQLLPIGRDRAHRNYWVFTSLPGLYVECNPLKIDNCLPHPTPCAADLGDTISHVRRLFEEQEGQNASDKENDGYGENEFKESRPMNVSGKKMLGDKNSSSGNLSGVRQEDNLDQMLQKDSLEGELLVCTASEDCPVHCLQTRRNKWSCFLNEDDITCLLNSLNDRGIRENALRTAIIREKQRILEGIPECPVHKLNPSKFQHPEIEPREDTRSITLYKKGYTNLDFPPDAPVSHIMECTLRGIILDLEKKIKFGFVGSLKVGDRLAWRNAIKNGKYDKQVVNLSWGCHTKKYLKKQVALCSTQTNRTEEESCMSNEEKSSVDSTEVEDTDHFEVVDRIAGPSLCSGKISKSGDESASQIERRKICRKIAKGEEQKYDQLNEDTCENSMPHGDSSLGRSNTCSDLVTHKNPVIKDLASAILQLGQCIDCKFLQSPLVDEYCTKKTIRFKRWEDSLMNAVSFSQLFIHHLILDSSINWSKSALNAPCRICHRRGDIAKMLLCDTCNKGHHTRCLLPKLMSIPLGDWYCPVCFEEQIQPIFKDKGSKNAEHVTSSSNEEEPRQLISERKRKTLALDTEDDGVNMSTVEKLPRLQSLENRIYNKCSLKGDVIFCSSCGDMHHHECSADGTNEHPISLRCVEEKNWQCGACKAMDVAHVSNGT